ncbi:hypothetical protein [Streptomyces yaizuensis]|uniref:Uncharacterized protein n=1 Tax=Streptomyces yaizuensis TaxID=2989713 RepID=A0ABQ5NY56_9ACTN|nr:hypothetical protein [Streptomyces sp. YSPA8]GLF95283.1 hypothetical protein SYYSPA8_13320 [Streptomyces sp. YSPA8]
MPGSRGRDAAEQRAEEIRQSVSAVAEAVPERVGDAREPIGNVVQEDPQPWASARTGDARDAWSTLTWYNIYRRVGASPPALERARQLRASDRSTTVNLALGPERRVAGLLGWEPWQLRAGLSTTLLFGPRVVVALIRKVFGALADTRLGRSVQARLESFRGLPERARLEEGPRHEEQAELREENWRATFEAELLTLSPEKVQRLIKDLAAVSPQDDVLSAKLALAKEFTVVQDEALSASDEAALREASQGTFSWGAFLQHNKKRRTAAIQRHTEEIDRLTEDSASVPSRFIAKLAGRGMPKAVRAATISEHTRTREQITNEKEILYKEAGVLKFLLLYLFSGISPRTASSRMARLNEGDLKRLLQYVEGVVAAAPGRDTGVLQGWGKQLGREAGVREAVLGIAKYGIQQSKDKLKGVLSKNQKSAIRIKEGLDLYAPRLLERYGLKSPSQDTQDKRRLGEELMRSTNSEIAQALEQLEMIESDETSDRVAGAERLFQARSRLERTQIPVTT